MHVYVESFRYGVLADEKMLERLVLNMVFNVTHIGI